MIIKELKIMEELAVIKQSLGKMNLIMLVMKVCQVGMPIVNG